MKATIIMKKSFEILMDLHVLRTPEYEEVAFGRPSICVPH
jgi:hypothetical protein